MIKSVLRVGGVVVGVIYFERVEIRFINVV